MDPSKYDLVNIKMGIEMLVTGLPIHSPEDVERLAGIFKGVEWGKVGYAMGADVWQAILAGGPDAVDTLDQYLDFFLQIIGYMRGERTDLPDAMAQDPKLADALLNRRKVIEMAMEKKEK